MLCHHPRCHFARVLFAGGCHIAEVCSDCGANVRGAGVWVPRHQVGQDVDSLPVAADRRTPEQKGEQPTFW